MQNVILVTGASSGFGALASRALADAGQLVYASMRETKGRNEPRPARGPCGRARRRAPRDRAGRNVAAPNQPRISMMRSWGSRPLQSGRASPGGRTCSCRPSPGARQPRSRRRALPASGDRAPEQRPQLGLVLRPEREKSFQDGGALRRKRGGRAHQRQLARHAVLAVADTRPSPGTGVELDAREGELVRCVRPVEVHGPPVRRLDPGNHSLHIPLAEPQCPTREGLAAAVSCASTAAARLRTPRARGTRRVLTA
jgi:hypothetical protein